MSDWGGVDDLSGMGNAKWDSNNLYIAFSATDDAHFQQGIGSNIWQGDAIQFTIDTSRINGAGSAGYHEIGVGLGTTGVQKYRWTATNGKTPGDFNEMQCSIVRNDDTKKTDYEIAIPWNQLLPEGASPADGDLILAPAATNGNGDDDDSGNGNGSNNNGNTVAGNELGQITTSGNVATLVLDTAKIEAAMKSAAGNYLFY